MATLRKCGTTRSSNGSPIMNRHHHRRVTLKALLRDPIDGDWKLQPRKIVAPSHRRRRGRTVSEGRSTLKELMLATSPFDKVEEEDELQREIKGGMSLLEMGRRGVRTAGGLRFRFLKRAWRPMLGAIPE